MLWIFLTLSATPLQVARNAMQRGLVADAGPWGATLVRFLFGLPFSMVIFTVALLLTPDAAPQWTPTFWAGAVMGAVSQVAGTAFLLMAMSRSGFAVGTMLQQSSLPLTAVMGWLLLGDRLSAEVWAGLAVATVGLMLLSWPRRGHGRADLPGALLGLASGASLGLAFNGFRQAGQALDASHPMFSATAAVVVVQAMQSLALTAILAVARPQALHSVTMAWRSSLAAGLFGAAASTFWFGALALAPAAPVRAVGLIEGPIAAAVGRRLFREKLRLRQCFGGALTAAGLALCALG